MEVLATLTLPHVLQTAYGALTIAWTRYKTVQDQKAQCEVLLHRCGNLVAAIAKRLERGSDQRLLANVKVLEGWGLFLDYHFPVKFHHGYLAPVSM